MELSMDEPFSNELCADKPAVRGQNENLLKIMGDSSFYDLTLIAGDQKIGVHKCVVALHSEAMREKLKNRKYFRSLSMEWRFDCLFCYCCKMWIRLRGFNFIAGSKMDGYSIEPFR